MMPANTGHVDGEHSIAFFDKFDDGFRFVFVAGRANSFGFLAYTNKLTRNHAPRVVYFNLVGLHCIHALARMYSLS